LKRGIIVNTHLIFFSPTGTTKTILENIAKGIGKQIKIYDTTPAYSRITTTIKDGVAIFGVPVYAGRVPIVAAERIKNIKGDKTPAVAVVVYGNREYEDALVELKDLIEEAGFKVIAGGAFIGEHSYSSNEKPIAINRPDDNDKLAAFNFGKEITKKLAQNDLKTPNMKGNIPYKERIGIKGATPLTKFDICELCGTCSAVCPTDAITINNKVISDSEKCIMCCACIKKCPKEARYIATKATLERIEMLYKNCQIKKEPEIFI
jgi:ferredoxin